MPGDFYHDLIPAAFNRQPRKIEGTNLLIKDTVRVEFGFRNLHNRLACTHQTINVLAA